MHAVLYRLSVIVRQLPVSFVWLLPRFHQLYPAHPPGPCPRRPPAKSGARLPNFTAATRCPSFGFKLNRSTPQLAEGAVSIGWPVIAAASATLPNRESTISSCSRSRRLRPFIEGPEVIAPFILEVPVVLQAPNDDSRIDANGRGEGLDGVRIENVPADEVLVFTGRD